MKLLKSLRFYYIICTIMFIGPYLLGQLNAQLNFTSYSFNELFYIASLFFGALGTYVAVYYMASLKRGIHSAMVFVEFLAAKGLGIFLLENYEQSVPLFIVLVAIIIVMWASGVYMIVNCFLPKKIDKI